MLPNQEHSTYNLNFTTSPKLVSCTYFPLQGVQKSTDMAPSERLSWAELVKAFTETHIAGCSPDAATHGHTNQPVIVTNNDLKAA